MASASDPISDQGLAELELRQVHGRELAQGLAVLLTGRVEHAAESVERFLRYARDTNIDVNALWVAFCAGRPCAAALIVPGSGRTAMAFVSPLAESRFVAAAAAALRQAAARQDPSQVKVIQVLLEPGQELEAQALMEAGFKKLAHLIYMERPVPGPGGGAALHLAPPLRLLTWSQSNRQAFAKAILASYEQTLDCPGLLGMRQIDDIIAGHMATGQFVPELWMALYREEEPAAVMLLGALPQRQALELVYLGVSVPFRRQGMARRLVDHAIHLAHRRRCNKLMLAVDEHNSPALGLYRSMHFIATARRTALVLAL